MTGMTGCLPVVTCRLLLPVTLPLPRTAGPTCRTLSADFYGGLLHDGKHRIIPSASQHRRSVLLFPYEDIPRTTVLTCAAGAATVSQPHLAGHSFWVMQYYS